MPPEFGPLRITRYDPGMNRSIFLAMLLALSLNPLFAAPPGTAPATQPTTRPIDPSADGSILLHSRDVTIHGKTVRYEPKPEKNTVGFWIKKEDWISWDFIVKTPGKFQVLPLQGCGKDNGGSEVDFIIGEQTLKMTVQDTGHFQNFVERNIGTIELKPGTYTLSVKPQTKPHGAVMDLRQVMLKPVE